MRYVLLIYGDFAAYPPPGDPGFDELMGGHMALGDALMAAGMAGEPAEELESPATAKTLRVRNGETIMTDGPFVESKEQLGGFYTIEAANLDEAIKWATMIPDVKTGAVEIRPIIEH